MNPPLVTAVLTPDSPLRAVFPHGSIPLAAPGTRMCYLGGAKHSSECYFLAVRQLSPDQIAKMAEMMATAGQGTKEEALKHLASAAELPIRKIHVESVGVSLRAFI